MSYRDDQDYFERRASQERHAALRATSPESRTIHLDLAARYDARAGRPVAVQTRIGIRT